MAWIVAVVPSHRNISLGQLPSMELSVGANLYVRLFWVSLWCRLLQWVTELLQLSTPFMTVLCREVLCRSLMCNLLKYRATMCSAGIVGSILQCSALCGSAVQYIPFCSVQCIMWQFSTVHTILFSAVPGSRSKLGDRCREEVVAVLN